MSVQSAAAKPATTPKPAEPPAKPMPKAAPGPKATPAGAKDASDAAKAVARGLGDLADSSQARRAVKVAGELLGDGKGIHALMGAGGAELKGAFDKVAESALPRAAGSVMAHAEDNAGAMKQIE